MKVRSTVSGTRSSTRLAAVGCGILTALASVTIAACSGNPVFGSAADAFILILDRSVGDRVRLAERFAQHQPEF